MNNIVLCIISLLAMTFVHILSIDATAAKSKVLYPKHVTGGLVCYKDKRTDGGAFWSYANDQQRRPYVFHCPSTLSTWCVNVVTGRLSVRGCSGPAGVNRAGCFHVTDPERKGVTSKVCLCNRNYCNTASTLRRTTFVLSVHVVIVVLVVIDRYNIIHNYLILLSYVHNIN